MKFQKDKICSTINFSTQIYVHLTS